MEELIEKTAKELFRENFNCSAQTEYDRYQIPAMMEDKFVELVSPLIEDHSKLEARNKELEKALISLIARYKYVIKDLNPNDEKTLLLAEQELNKK